MTEHTTKKKNSDCLLLLLAVVVFSSALFNLFHSFARKFPWKWAFIATAFIFHMQFCTVYCFEFVRTKCTNTLLFISYTQLKGERINKKKIQHISKGRRENEKKLLKNCRGASIHLSVYAVHRYEFNIQKLFMQLHTICLSAIFQWDSRCEELNLVCVCVCRREKTSVAKKETHQMIQQQTLSSLPYCVRCESIFLPSLFVAGRTHFSNFYPNVLQRCSNECNLNAKPPLKRGCT